MPRGRKSTVRYYFDSVPGSVIAVAKEGVRVLQEIIPGAKKAAPARRGKRRGRPPGSKNKKSQATTEGPAEGQATATPKRRGRKKKATS
jgi:hypothetical protein